MVQARPSTLPSMLLGVEIAECEKQLATLTAQIEASDQPISGVEEPYACTEDACLPTATATCRSL